MKNAVIIFTAFLFLFSPRGILAYGEVVFNEIAWMGTKDSSANEWMELKNDTNSEVDLSGWRFEWRSGEYGITLGSPKCANSRVTAGGYFLLERTDDLTLPGISADCIYTGALSNSGEDLVLKNSSGVMVDKVQASSGWPAGDNTTKETMQRTASGWITATSTPRSATIVIQTPSSPSPPSLSPLSPSLPSSAGLVPTPTIKVYAGGDKIVVAGSSVEFSGYALGFEGEALEKARLWWNFGDGGSAEGARVSHIFQVPGTYTAGLHASSGVFAASDYLMVEVIPNQISIEDVIVGGSGYIKLFNSSSHELDIGEWIIEDASGKKFFIPPRTKIGRGAQIALSNVTTGLFSEGSGEFAILRYLNLAIAKEWRRSQPTAAAKQIGDKEKTEENKAKISTVSSPEPALKIASSDGSKENFAQVSSAVTLTPKMFFMIALAVGLMGAMGFLLAKKWIL